MSKKTIYNALGKPVFDYCDAVRINVMPMKFQPCKIGQPVSLLVKATIRDPMISLIKFLSWDNLENGLTALPCDA